MRFVLLVLAFVAAVQLAPRPARANDAGESATADGGPEDSSAEGAAGSSFVIACDGALCDTLQGRPTCAVDPPSVGHAVLHPAWLGVATALLAVGIGRRTSSPRGTPCPHRRPPAC